MAMPSEPDGFPIPNASAVLESIGGRVDFEVITPFDRYNSALSVGAFCVIANKTPWTIKVLRGRLRVWAAVNPNWIPCDVSVGETVNLLQK